MMEERGPGFHHISSITACADFDKCAARMRTLTPGALNPVLELDLPGFKGAYFDCRAAGASYIEIAEYRRG